MISQKEWDYIFSDQSRGDIHVVAEMADGLSQSGRLNLIEKEDEIEGGIKVLHAPGHTPQKFHSESGRGIFQED